MSSFCVHDGSRPIQVGCYDIFPGGSHHMRAISHFWGFDLIVPLDAGFAEVVPRSSTPVIPGPIIDYQPPPAGFKRFMEDTIIPDLRSGGKVLVFCLGGHGRTGTVLAGLIALLEPDVEDPVSEIRNRYCPSAVETREQAEWVFALRGRKLPKHLYGIRSVPIRRRIVRL